MSEHSVSKAADAKAANANATKSEHSSSDAKRELLRHTLATLAYRGGKAIRGAPASFSDFAGAGKTPGQILAHVCDLLDWGLSMANGERKWVASKPTSWDGDSARFYAALKSFDDYLASPEEVQAPLEKLFQAPIADSLTHVGQIAMLRRMAGVPMKSEGYFASDIVVGRVGAEQTPAKREF